MYALKSYLVCELGDPHGFIVCVVQGCSVSNKCFLIGTIEMEGDSVYLLLQSSTNTYRGNEKEPHSTIGAPFNERLHPIKSSLIVCARRRNKIVSLIFERIYMLLPQRNTVLRAHV